MKRILLKLVFGLLVEIVYNFALRKGKPWADELKELLEEIRMNELK